MPLYEYQCDACAHRFEVIQKFSDPPIEVCPKCAGAVKKLLSSPAIQFKGSGWYITDYARSGRSEGASSSKSDSHGESAQDSKGESKADSKGEAKAESKSETKSESKGEAKTEAKPAAKPNASPTTTP
jgi:putative FmdB family regulatory protein